MSGRDHLFPTFVLGLFVADPTHGLNFLDDFGASKSRSFLAKPYPFFSMILEDLDGALLLNGPIGIV